MMSENQIKQAVKERLLAVNGSCDTGHIDHNDGVFRGLIWALTGSDPGTYLTKDVAYMLRLAGIPCAKNDDGTLQI